MESHTYDDAPDDLDGQRPDSGHAEDESETDESGPLSPRASAIAEKIALGMLLGKTKAEIAADVGRSTRTIRRIQVHPDFRSAIERARGALRAEAIAEGEAGRVEALRAARKVLRDFTISEGDDRPVSYTDAMTAARVVLGATQPPSEAQRERARAQILAQLPEDLRAKVLEHLDHGEARKLAALTDAELFGLAGEVKL